MREPGLADRLRDGACLISGWVALPEPLIAEIAARQPFDAVTLDMQHGLHDTASVMRAISAIAFGGKPAVVRVPVDNFAMASRALDMGAEVIVAPMVNSVADAEALVAATKYPPLGDRSWGPLRAMAVLGVPDMPTQLKIANRSTLALAMIETERALDALDDILAVEGLDGVFMGPSDLSVTLSNGAEIAPTATSLDAPIRAIAGRARVAGKVAGAFAVTADRARFFKDAGYGLIAVGTDTGYLTMGMNAMISDFHAA